MELENKLNEIRNQELKTLGEFQVTKIRELDECLRQTENETKDGEYEIAEQRFQ